MKKTLTLFLLLVSGSAYSDTLTVPLVAECREPAKYFFEKHGQRLGITAELQKFDMQLDAHTSVIGVLTLRGPGHTKQELIAVVHTILSICYPTNRTILKKSDNQFSEKLKETLEMNRALGIEHTYILDTNDSIEIHYNLGKQKLVK